MLRVFLKKMMYKKMTAEEVIDTYNAELEDLAREYHIRVRELIAERDTVLLGEKNASMVSSCKRCGNELTMSNSLEGEYKTNTGETVHVYVCSNCGKIHRYIVTDAGYGQYNGHDKNVPSFRMLREKEDPIRERYFERIDHGFFNLE